MNIGERIKEARLRRNLTLLEVGESLGKTEATIQRYESGNIKNLKNDTIEELAKILNVSPAYLMGWEKPSNLHEVKPNFVRIPILGEIACGDPLHIADEAIGYMWELKEGLPKGDLFALTARGDSMSPTIPNESKVLVRVQSDVENGEIAAVLLNGDTEATLKRVKKQGDATMLVPDNNSYEVILINEHNPARIIGKVVRAIQDFI